jgi:hypothetical protein
VAKSISRNLVVRAKDGRVVVASSKSLELTALTQLSLGITKLLQMRQQAGKDLTKALDDAGYDVVAGEETDVYDAGDDSGGGEGEKGEEEGEDKGRGKGKAKAKKKPRR